jgi:SEC-C motif domain protein
MSVTRRGVGEGKGAGRDLCPCRAEAGTATGAGAGGILPSAALVYAACCGRHHGGAGLAGEPAPTPEALMRSRYSAFVRDVRAYLLDTWHPDHRPEVIEPPEPGLNWLGLRVARSATHPLASGAPVPEWAQGLSGGPLEAWGEVVFVARHKIGGRAHRLAEHSVFALQGGRWRYVCALPDAGGSPGAGAD